MRCLFLIFNPDLICKVEFCTQFNYYNSSTIELPQYDLAFVYVKQESVQILQNDKQHVLLDANKLLITNKHMQLNLQNSTCGIVLLLSGSAAKIMAQNIRDKIIIDLLYNSDITQMLNCIAKISNKNLDSDLSAYAYDFLCKLKNADMLVKQQNYPTLINQAVLEMQNNYAYLYGVDELSNKLGVSKNHLVRLFTKHLNISAGKYLTNIKINAAKQFLINTDLNVDLVSNMCGFSSANYFCKVFKNTTGITAARFRILHGGIQNLHYDSSNINDDIYV